MMRKLAFIVTSVNLVIIFCQSCYFLSSVLAARKHQLWK